MGTRLPPSSTFDDIADSPEQEQHTEAPPLPPRGGGAFARVLPAGIALAVAVLVVLPWTRRGWLLLLDWIPGPHPSLPRSFWGLDSGLQTGMPLALGIVGVSHVIGAATLSWLAIAVALAVAGVAAGRLVSGTWLARVGAGTLYAVNPLVFDRIFAGHIGYLLAYAMLPLFVASVLRRRDDISWRGMRPALWLALLTAFTPHFFWVGGIVVVAHVAAAGRGRGRCRSLAWGGLVMGCALVMSAYFIVPSIGQPAPVRVGQADLASYRTRGDPRLGLAVNVAGLYGFWRPEPRLPKNDVAGWPLFLGAIAILAATGLRRARRSETAATRHLAAVLALSGVAGFFLALGDQGPTGPLFRFLFDHLPGFAIMREPQKFVALLALAYAVGFGFALDDLARRASGRRPRLAVGALAMALPVLYTPSLFFGLAGQAKVTHYPASWTAADRLMGSGAGKILSLPWHEYLSFPFTGHVIANPADAFFRRDVIGGDNVELSKLPTASTLTRSGYLEFLYSHGSEVCAFGRLVAPLGVEYVALARTVDSANYAWLDRQVDLVRVLDRPEIVVYRNLAHSGTGTGAGSRGAALGRAADWGDLATLANRGALEAVPYVVDNQGAGPIAPGECGTGAAGTAAASGGRAMRPTSPVSYRVPPGPAGFVGLPEAFDPSWRLGGRGAIELAGGTVGLATDGNAGTARFGHWNRVRVGYAISVLTAALVGAGTLVKRVGRFATVRSAKECPCG